MAIKKTVQKKSAVAKKAKTSSKAPAKKISPRKKKKMEAGAGYECLCVRSGSFSRQGMRMRRRL